MKSVFILNRRAKTCHLYAGCNTVTIKQAGVRAMYWGNYTYNSIVIKPEEWEQKKKKKTQ